jgi:hypothetical protein
LIFGTLIKQLNRQGRQERRVKTQELVFLGVLEHLAVSKKAIKLDKHVLVRPHNSDYDATAHASRFGVRLRIARAGRVS